MKWREKTRKGHAGKLMKIAKGDKDQKIKHAVEWRGKNRNGYAGNELKKVTHPLRFFSRHFTACFYFLEK